MQVNIIIPSRNINVLTHIYICICINQSAENKKKFFHYDNDGDVCITFMKIKPGH